MVPPALSHRSSLPSEKAPLGAKKAAWRSRCPGAGRRDAGTETKPDQRCCFGLSLASLPPLPPLPPSPPVSPIRSSSSSSSSLSRASSTSRVHCHAATPTLATTREAPSRGPPAASYVSETEKQGSPMERESRGGRSRSSVSPEVEEVAAASASTATLVRRRRKRRRETATN